MRALLASCSLLLLALPAQASTLPRVDLGPDQITLAGGAFDLSMDRSIGPKASFGAGYAFLSSHTGYVRGVYRLVGEPDGFCMGLTLAAGLAPYPVWLDQTDTSAGPVDTLAQLFLQPAVVWSVPFWNFRFRASLGPTFFSRVRQQKTYRFLESEVFPISPNAELAYNFGRGEVTLGGNAIVGARMFF